MDKFKTHNISLILCRLLVFILLSISTNLSADDNQYDPGDPKERVAFIMNELLRESAKIRTGESKFVEDYFMQKVEKYANIHMLLEGLLTGTQEGMMSLSEEDQNVLVEEFSRYLVRKNIDDLRRLLTASKIEVLSSRIDYTIALVEVAIHLPEQKPKMIRVFLVRGWDDWKIGDLIFEGQRFSDICWETFGDSINREGARGVIKKCKLLNAVQTGRYHENAQVQPYPQQMTYNK